MVKKRKSSVRARGRFLVVFLFFIFIICTLCYSIFLDFNRMNDMNMKMKSLHQEKDDLLYQQEALEADIKKLSDPEYVAKYAREKFFYSKEGELILRFK